MVEQLSLFQGLDEKKKRRRKEADRPALDELFLSVNRFRIRSSYLEMLRVLSHFPRYSIFNAFLLYLQEPDASMVATAALWRQKFGRTLKPDAKPLIILAPMSPVRFLFDVRDTEGEPLQAFSDKPPVSAEGLRARYENTVHNASLHGIAVRETLGGDDFHCRVVVRAQPLPPTFLEHRVPPETSVLVLLQVRERLEEKYGFLAGALGGVFCGHHGSWPGAWWPDRSAQDEALRSLEADSVGYLVFRRAGLDENRTPFFSNRKIPEKEMPPLRVSAVFQAVQYIEEMAKGLWKTAKRSTPVAPRA